LEESAKLEDSEMQDTQASTQVNTVSQFAENQSPGAAQFKIAVNLMPNNSSGSNLDMVCDTVLTESHQLNFGQH
jgi:hypothetical protein